MFENVRSITHPRNKPVLEALERAALARGYKLCFVAANAAEYGVPQRRQRVFLIGSKLRQPDAPEPTHAAPEVAAEAEKKPFEVAGPALAPFAGMEFFESEEVVGGRWAEHLRDRAFRVATTRLTLPGAVIPIRPGRPRPVTGTFYSSSIPTFRPGLSTPRPDPGPVPSTGIRDGSGPLSWLPCRLSLTATALRAHVGSGCGRLAMLFRSCWEGGWWNLPSLRSASSRRAASWLPHEGRESLLRLRRS